MPEHGDHFRELRADAEVEHPVYVQTFVAAALTGCRDDNVADEATPTELDDVNPDFRNS